MRIVGTDSLCQNVMDTCGLHDSTHRTTRNDAGSGRGRLQQHMTRTKIPDDFIWDSTLQQLYLPHILTGAIRGFLDGIRNLVGLS